MLISAAVAIAEKQIGKEVISITPVDQLLFLSDH